MPVKWTPDNDQMVSSSILFYYDPAISHQFNIRTPLSILRISKVPSNLLISLLPTQQFTKLTLFPATPQDPRNPLRIHRRRQKSRRSLACVPPFASLTPPMPAHPSTPISKLTPNSPGPRPTDRARHNRTARENPLHGQSQRRRPLQHRIGQGQNQQHAVNASEASRRCGSGCADAG